MFIPRFNSSVFSFINFLGFRSASVVVVSLVVALNAQARDLYVAVDGSDANDGRSPRSAFRTLAKAATAVQPGDTVLIGDGTYDTDSGEQHSSLVNISISGRPDAWITWKPARGAKPVLRSSAWNCIRVTASYQIIEDLTLVGYNDSIILLDALADAKIKEKDGKRYFGAPFYNTNGLFITGREQTRENKPHHIIVRRCSISKFAGGGLTAIEADYVTFEDNLIFENAWYMRYGGSGISLLNNWAHDDKPGYHVVIQRNKVWNNKTLVPWEVIGKLSDGNGIILDVTDPTLGGAANNPTGDVGASGNHEAAKPTRPPYKGRTLIANNVSAFNGGSGIHAFKTRHVDIINNTTYWNGQVVGYQEVFANRAEDVNILNNVIVPRPRGRVTMNHSANRDVRWDYNLYPEAQTILTGPNDIVGDPQFVRVDRDLRLADFRLAKGSLAIDSATDELAQATDLDGKKRPQGRKRDRGAYEQ